MNDLYSKRRRSGHGMWVIRDMVLSRYEPALSTSLPDRHRLCTIDTLLLEQRAGLEKGYSASAGAKQ